MAGKDPSATRSKCEYLSTMSDVSKTVSVLTPYFSMFLKKSNICAKTIANRTKPRVLSSSPDPFTYKNANRYY